MIEMLVYHIISQDISPIKIELAMLHAASIFWKQVLTGY